MPLRAMYYEPSTKAEIFKNKSHKNNTRRYYNIKRMFGAG